MEAFLPLPPSSFLSTAVSGLPGVVPATQPPPPGTSQSTQAPRSAPASCTVRAVQMTAEDGDRNNHQVVSSHHMTDTVLSARPAPSEAWEPRAGTAFSSFRRGNGSSEKAGGLSTRPQPCGVGGWSQGTAKAPPLVTAAPHTKPSPEAHIKAYFSPRSLAIPCHYAIIFLPVSGKRYSVSPVFIIILFSVPRNQNL